MKHLLFCISLILTFSVSYSQPRGVNIREINDKRLTRILSMLDTTITRSNDNMTVSLYHIWNELGSAHIPEDDEVSESYMVSMGEDKGSEIPADHLFSLGDFLGPKLLQFKELSKNKSIVVIEHGSYVHKKKSKFLISRNNVIVLK